MPDINPSTPQIAVGDINRAYFVARFDGPPDQLLVFPGVHLAAAVAFVGDSKFNVANGIVSIGNQSGVAMTTGLQNTSLGGGSLRDTTDGDNNVAVGYAANRANITGNRNTVVGTGALLVATAGDENTVVGENAMVSATGAASRNTAVGKSALGSYLGSDAVAIGAFALVSATGVQNTALGYNGGGSILTGIQNTFLGYSAGANGGQKTNAINSIAIGFNAFTTADNQVVIGNSAIKEWRMFGIRMGRYASANESIYLAGAGNMTSTGNANVAIGNGSMFTATNKGESVAVGRNTMYWHTGGGSCVAIGNDAMKNGNNPSGGVLPGGTVLGNPTDCTAVGSEAGRDWQGIIGAVAVGRLSQAKTTTGTGNTSVGDASLRDNITGFANVAVGYGTMAFNITGNYNVALGQAALYDNTVGHENNSIGYENLENATGSGNVGLGHRAGRALTAASDNVMIGRNAGTDALQKVDAQNSIAIGTSAFTDKNNQVVLGHTTITETILRGALRCTTFTVAGLPTAASAGAGARAFVTNATATTFASIVTGGGANGVPVYSDGTNWRIG